MMCSGACCHSPNRRSEHEKTLSCRYCRRAFAVPRRPQPRPRSYTADPQQSRLEFVGVQAGAEFKGVFHKFTAAVDFAPEALPSSRIDVQIDMNSVDSLDKDRDTTIRGKDIFDVAHYPTAHYVDQVHHQDRARGFPPSAR